METIKTKIFDAVIELGETFGEAITQRRAEIYAEHLCHLTPLELKKAFDHCAVSCRRFPSIAEINEVINKKRDPMDDANEMAGTILGAIRPYGYMRPLEARKALGEVAWKAIEMFGGWKLLCDTESDAMDTVRAQLRGICKAVMGMKDRKNTDPTLPFQAKNTMKLQESLRQIETDVVKHRRLDEEKD